MAGVKLLVIQEGGLWAAARRIHRGLVEVDQFKVIFSLLGRDDLPGGELIQAFEDLIVNVRRFNQDCLVVAVGPVPRADDTRKDVGMCVNAAKCIKACSVDLRDVEYSRLAEEFYSRSGVNETAILPSGVTALGWQKLRIHIQARLRSPTCVHRFGKIVT